MRRVVPQVFHRSTNTIARVSIFGALFVVGLAGFGLDLVNRSSYVTQAGVAHEQPVPFSHRHHASELVHVCDVYDALRTKRPYRDAWESDKALTYIEERAGVEFEPRVARAFVAMVREWDQRVATAESKLAREQDAT